MPEFYDIHENELIIPGLDRTYTFLHISDSHLCVTDSLSPEWEAAHVRKREIFWQGGKAGFANYFGQPMDEYRKMLPTQDAFRMMLDFGRTHAVDAVLSTGDLLEQMHGAGERFVRAQLDGYPTPFLASPGNHETAACPGIWAEGVQTLDFPGLRIVSVDDRLQTVTDETLNALEKLLSEGIPVILMMHIPLLTDGNRATRLSHREVYYYIDENTCDENGRRFIDLLHRSPALKLILCGHVHGYLDGEPLQGVRQIIAPQAMAGGLNLLTVRG